MNGTGIAQGTGTGQMGVVAGGAGLVTQSVGRLTSWLNTPFTTPLDPINVFLLVGTILVAIIAWNLILYHLRIAAEAIT